MIKNIKSSQNLQNTLKLMIKNLSPAARRSRCERRTSGVRRSKKLPAKSSCQRQPIFLCLFRAMKPNQTTSIFCLQLSKAHQPTFVCLLRAHKNDPVEGCSDPSILKQSEQNFFFVLRPASWLEVATYILCAPYCLPSPLRLFSGGMILSFFLLFNNPPF